MSTGAAARGGEPDRAEEVRQIDASARAYWLALADTPTGERYEGPDLTWVYTGYPVLNRVMDARLEPADAPDRIREVVERFRTWDADVTWLLGPSTRPPSLGRSLEAHGFASAGRWTGMALDLKRPAGGRPAGGRFSVHRVADGEWTDEWLRIVSDSFRLPPVARDVFGHLARRTGGTDGTSLAHYVGVWGGRPVCTATVLTTEAEPLVAGIYLVGTLPGFRSRGHGSAIMRHVLARAHERGCRRAVLQATGAGRSLYRSLGFREVCAFDLYRWAPERQARGAAAWRGRLRRLARSLLRAAPRWRTP